MNHRNFNQNMATGVSKSRCLICEKEKATVKCSGCLEDFCFDHLVEHRQQLNQQLDYLENQRNLFRQNLFELTINPQKCLSSQEIDRWEQESIEKIQQTAVEAKELLLKYTDEYMTQMEMKLNKITEELKEIRQENDFNEIDLQEFRRKLTKLSEELDKPKNISIEESSSSLVNKISIVTTSRKCIIYI
jgi:chromosome segregation ATPase